MKLFANHKITFGALLLAFCLNRAGAQTNAPASLEQISGAMGRAQTVFTRFVQESFVAVQ